MKGVREGLSGIGWNGPLLKTNPYECNQAMLG